MANIYLFNYLLLFYYYLDVPVLKNEFFTTRAIRFSLVR